MTARLSLVNPCFSQGFTLTVQPPQVSVNHHLEVRPLPESSLEGRHESILIVYLLFPLLHPTLLFPQCHSYHLLEESSHSFLYIVIPLLLNPWITSLSWKIQLCNIYEHTLSKEKSCEVSLSTFPDRTVRFTSTNRNIIPFPPSLSVGRKRKKPTRLIILSLLQ